MRRPTALWRCLLLAGLLAALLPDPARGHWGERVFPVYELPTSALPDLHDGSLADWEEVLPSHSIDSREFVPSFAFDYVIDPASLSFRIWLAWNYASQRLYVAIESVDDLYYNAYEGVGEIREYSADAFELLIDGDHSGGPFFPNSPTGMYIGENELLTYVQAQRYSVVAQAPDGSSLGLSHTKDDLWLHHPPYMDQGGFVFDGLPSIIGIELYLTPWNQLVIKDSRQSVTSRLDPGSIIGIDVFVFDMDGSKQSDVKTAVLEGLANPINASGFKDAQLIPCDYEDCSKGVVGESAVQADSWGRIKASFH